MTVVLEIGGVDITPYLEQGWNIQFTKESGGNEFVAENGDIISDEKGSRVTISFALRSVPFATAQRISNILNGSSFTCTYSTPLTLTSAFTTDSLKSVPKNRAALWDFDVTIKSKSLSKSGDCL